MPNKGIILNPAQDSVWASGPELGVPMGATGVYAKHGIIKPDIQMYSLGDMYRERTRSHL